MELMKDRDLKGFICLLLTYAYIPNCFLLSGLFCFCWIRLVLLCSPVSRRFSVLMIQLGAILLGHMESVRIGFLNLNSK